MKAPSYPPRPLRAETYPLGITRTSGIADEERRKEDRAASSVSEAYISAGTNCPIIHSVRQQRCSLLIRQRFFSLRCCRCFLLCSFARFKQPPVRSRHLASAPRDRGGARRRPVLFRGCCLEGCYFSWILFYRIDV